MLWVAEHVHLQPRLVAGVQQLQRLRERKRGRWGVERGEGGGRYPCSGNQSVSQIQALPSSSAHFACNWLPQGQPKSSILKCSTQPQTLDYELISLLGHILLKPMKVSYLYIKHITSATARRKHREVYSIASLNKLLCQVCSISRTNSFFYNLLTWIKYRACIIPCIIKKNIVIM